MAPQDGPTPSASAGGPPASLNLVTLNCWGLLHLSALRTPRLASIGQHLALLSPAPDIVCLQECWTQADYAAVRAATAAVLPHGKFYHSGAFGGGLAILSRWPLLETSMVRYPLNGRPTAFFRGDWYVGKGVACATVRVGPDPAHVLAVFNTHTHAPYERGNTNTYLCHRAAQSWEMAKLLRAAADRGHLVLALGDFNMLPCSLLHRIVTAHAPVRDVWRQLRPDSALGPAHHPAEAARGRPVPSAAFNLAENGATSDGAYNTWRWNKNQRNMLRAGHPCPVDPDTPDPHGKRLDYIFASLADPTSSQPGWVVKSASVALTERHPELNVSLSDHFAVQATLVPHSPPGPSSSSHQAPPTGPSGHAPDVMSTEDRLAMYDEILALIYSYTKREVSQQYWRGRRFYASLVLWVACLVAVWFSPANFVAFLLMLLSSLGLVAGVIEGLLALLFFSSELNALKEFQWEVENAKLIASGGEPTSDEDDPVQGKLAQKKRNMTQ
jgi:sphingomyelin phosphodiesterase 2